MSAPRYTDDQILAGASYDIYRSATAIAEIVGCDAITAKRRMPRLRDKGKVKSVDVELGGWITMCAWIRCDSQNDRTDLH